MVIIRRRTLILILAIFFFLIGFLSVRYLSRPRIRVGEHLIIVNYRAKINPKKNYHLKLWDYKWPGTEGDTWYQQFIKKAVKDFERENPNIRVSLKLLDFIEGPKVFSQALASGNAPDVYCSAYGFPEFNYQWQIPAGIFLKPQELDIFYPNLKKVLSLEKYLLNLPRWSAPGLWVGNRALMEQYGLPVEKIQRQGWSWQDLTAISMDKAKPLFIGNYSANGLFPQLLAINTYEHGESNLNHVLDLVNFVNGTSESDLEANMFQLFLSGKVMLLGGVRPLVYDFIKQKAAVLKIGWEPVILPFPGDRSKIVLPVENSVISVYRHHKTAGDDQLAAATRLAYFISTYHQTVPWERLKVVPSITTTGPKWAGNIGEDYSSQLIDWFRDGDIVNIKVSPRYEAEIYPGLKSFLSGKISRQEFKNIIRNNYFEAKK